MTLALVENGVTNLRPMANISSRCAPGTTLPIPWARPNLNHLNLKNTSQTATTYRKVIKRPKIIYAAPHLKRPSSVAARLVEARPVSLIPLRNSCCSIFRRLVFRLGFGRLRLGFACHPRQLFRDLTPFGFGKVANIDDVGGFESPDQGLDPGHDDQEAGVTHQIDRFSL